MASNAENFPFDDVILYGPGRDKRDPLDFLSRHPLSETVDDMTGTVVMHIVEAEHAVMLGEMQRETRGDRTLQKLDCFTLLLAQHLADVSCYIGPSMPSGICMEIHTEIVQKRKKKPSRDKGIPRQLHVYL